MSLLKGHGRWLIALRLQKESERMKVKEIMIAAAKLLGIEQEITAYCNGQSEACEDAEILLDCFQEIESEIALDYLPLIVEEEKSSVNGQYGYSTFENQVVRIIRVSDEWGNSLPFKLYARYMTTQPGKIKVTYTYSPKKKGLTDSSDFTIGVSERVFAYGIAAAYSIVKGLYEEGEVWDKKYKNSLSAAVREMRSKTMKGRVWV
jgi:hypothetical protein